MAQQFSGAPYLNSYGVQDRYGYNGEVSPDVAIEEQALNRKQQIANLLLQQGLQGAGGGQMVGRFFVPTSGTQHAAKIGEILAGALGTRAIDSQRQDLSTNMNEERARAVQRYVEQTQGKQVPERTLPQGTPDQVVPVEGPPNLVQPDVQNAGTSQGLQEVPPSITIPGTPPTQGPVNEAQFMPSDPSSSRRAVMEAMSHADPRVRESVKFMEQMKAQEEEKQAARAFQAIQADENRAVRREGIATQAQTALQALQGNMLMRQGLIDQSDKNSERHAELLRQQQADKIEADKWKAKLDFEAKKQHDETLKAIAAGHDSAKTAVAGMKAGAKGKLPAAIGSKFMENSQNLRMAENALDLIGKHKDATGVKGYLPDPLLQRMDPSGVDTRAAVANLGSMVIHDRSGAAVTASEFPRLRPFIPSATDAPDVVKKKLTQFVTEYKKINQEMTEFYKESGYDIPENWHQPGGSASTQTLPEGAKQIGTSGGKPVYQLPDGSKVIAE